jgi:hypothetical protein
VGEYVALSRLERERERRRPGTAEDAVVKFLALLWRERIKVGEAATSFDS